MTDILSMIGIITLVFAGILIIPLVIGLFYVEFRDIAKFWYKVGKRLRNSLGEK